MSVYIFAPMPTFVTLLNRIMILFSYFAYMHEVMKKKKNLQAFMLHFMVNK